MTLAEDDYSDFELRLWDGEIDVPTPTPMDFAVQVGQKLGFLTISDPVVSLVYSTLCVE